MICAFGQKRIRFEGKDDVIRSLRLKWKKYQLPSDESQPDAIIRFDGILPGRDGPGSEGWTPFPSGNAQETTSMYSLKGKSVFTLRYQPGHYIVTVLADQADLNAVRMGAQFGVMIALHRDCVGLHGVTLLCGREIIILSAPSGTGKTTLAGLLERYCDAIVINGDFALLSPSTEGVVFEPTPFCGSSGRSLNRRMRVNRIVFLGQAESNEWRNLQGREAAKQFMSNVFIPTWDESMKQIVQNNVVKCIQMLEVNSFSFVPTQDAAKEFFSHLRFYDEGSS